MSDDAPGIPIARGMRRLTAAEERERDAFEASRPDLRAHLDEFDRVRNRGAAEIRTRYFTR